MADNVILVTTDDKVIGECDKMSAHVKGLLHRAFSIFIFNSNGELLIQRRAFSKYHSGGLWSNSCCSHPRVNEDLLTAAHRRLKEELGFDCELKKKHSFYYKAQLDNKLFEHEFDHILVGKYDGKLNINRDEVDSFRWITIQDLLLELREKPEIFTFWFKEIIKINKELFLQK